MSLAKADVEVRKIFRAAAATAVAAAVTALLLPEKKEHSERPHFDNVSSHSLSCFPFFPSPLLILEKGATT